MRGRCDAKTEWEREKEAKEVGWGSHDLINLCLREMVDSLPLTENETSFHRRSSSSSWLSSLFHQPQLFFWSGVKEFEILLIIFRLCCTTILSSLVFSTKHKNIVCPKWWEVKEPRFPSISSMLHRSLGRESGEKGKEKKENNNNRLRMNHLFFEMSSDDIERRNFLGIFRIFSVALTF